MIEENNGPTYRLHGEALHIAKELHQYSKETSQEYRQIEAKVYEYSSSLMEEFNLKHNDRFTDIFKRLADAVGVPVSLMRTFHLDATYLEDHNLAFMKQGPIEDNVMVMDDQANTEEDTLP